MPYGLFPASIFNALYSPIPVMGRQAAPKADKPESEINLSDLSLLQKSTASAAESEKKTLMGFFMSATSLEVKGRGLKFWID